MHPFRVFASILILAILLIPLSAQHIVDQAKPKAVGNMMLKGVCHAHAHRYGKGYGTAMSKAELEKLKAIGVNTISLTNFAVQNKFNATTVMGYKANGKHTFGQVDPTLSDKHLRDEIKQIHALEMSVMLKPHIWSHDFWRGGQWHGSVDQETKEDQDAWWGAYEAFILHYAKLAAEEKVAYYCIGTELVKITDKQGPRWHELIKKIRKIYPGKLTYSAHWHQEVNKITFWGELDFIGIGAYYPKKAPTGTDVKTLLKLWEPIKADLKKLAEKHKKPIVFTEVGYRPADNAHIEPWKYSGGEPDLHMQTKAYDAMFQTFENEAWFAGVYLWKTFTDGRQEKEGFTFLRRPAAKLIKQWFTQEKP